MTINEFIDINNEMSDLELQKLSGFYSLVNQAIFCYVQSNDYSNFQQFPEISRAVALALKELNSSLKLNVIDDRFEINGDRPMDSNQWWPIFMKCVTDILIQDVNKISLLNIIYNRNYRMQVTINQIKIKNFGIIYLGLSQN